jgi:peptidoglycan hydrolase-like protein with peptidoglycan-binding domain
VKQVQTELKQKGYYEGDVDGIMGAQTRAGLRRYQKENSLAGDGRLTHDTAIHLGVAAKGENPDPADHFEDAGAEIKEHYGKGGKALGKGSKEMGKDIKEGEVTEGAQDLGKGAGKFGKEVGKGTAKAAKKVGKGVKDAVDGDDEKKKKD